MRRGILWLTIFLSVTLCQADQVSEARGVLSRLIGARSSSFTLKLMPRKELLDYYEVAAKDGKVTVKGTSGVAICRGAYDYLRNKCHCLVTWDGDQLALPAVFPDQEAEQVVCPNRFRHYFNVVTFGYTTNFWDSKRWRREIDWMALHGINMPLSENGQERVWEDVWRSYGLTDQEILAYFSGPAFLPWHRMGNLNGHGGPMPQHWLDSEERLQKKILASEQQLGMKPVTPAFSSFVPPALANHVKGVKLGHSSGWGDFAPTAMLDPRDPLFGEIGKRFIETYRRRIGETSHYYLADVYNEMTPVVSKDRVAGDLADNANAVYRSIVAGDPDGTWVMQGWLFFNEADFWKEPNIAAFLNAVPDDRMVLLDLYSDSSEIWRKSEAFRSKPYIWNMLHDFGQNTRLYGDMPLIAKKPIDALNDSGNGRMSGMGLTMEGTEQNAALYELMLDAMWVRHPIDLNSWLPSYASARYGSSDPAGARIWREMLDQFYRSMNDTWAHDAYQLRPNKTRLYGISKRAIAQRNLIEQMLAAPVAVKDNPLFRRDLVDVVKAYAGEEATIAAYHAVNDADPKAWVNSFDTLMSQLDGLLATVPSHRMDRWIAMARAQGASPTEKDFMERNARLQVTVWGGLELYDYAAKQWSGLVGDFYRPRWDQYFVAVRKPGFDQKTFEKSLADWELAWCSRRDLPKPAKVDAIAQTKLILKTVDSWSTVHSS